MTCAKIWTSDEYTMKEERTGIGGKITIPPFSCHASFSPHERYLKFKFEKEILS
jgi:rRNA maturation protein Nop10